MARQSQPQFLVASQEMIVGLMVTLGLLSLFINLLLLSPLEASQTNGDFRVPHFLPPFSPPRHKEPVHPPNATKVATKLPPPPTLPPLSKKDPMDLISFPKLNEQEGKEHILSIFEEAGVVLNETVIAQLPTWSQVQAAVGDHPYILGLDKCEEFREKVPAVERMLGSSGMFNTGTNLVTHLLKQNCQIPERVEKYGPKASREEWGMRWQVPWGKHTPAKYRLAHATEKAAKINKEWLMPIVTIRNPYSWFKSMCNNGYTAKWDHGKTHDCPNIMGRYMGRDKTYSNPVTVRFAEKREETHQSIAHLWNEWYAQYTKDADYPFLMIRMEDLVFYTKETTTAVCNCAGGKIRTDQPFKHVVDSAKADSVGHDHSTGIVQAWIKYSRPPPPQYDFTDRDYEAAIKTLDSDLMETFGYTHPPPNMN